MTSDPLKMPYFELLEMIHEAGQQPRVFSVNAMPSIPASCNPWEMAYSLKGSAGLYKYQLTSQREELKGCTVSF